MADAYDITITVMRNEGAFTRGGGRRNANVDKYSGLACRLHFYNRPSQSVEEGGPDASGSGRVNRDRVFFLFRKKPFPAILAKDRILDETTGKAYSVLHVRPYQFSLQVDAEHLDDEDPNTA